MNARQDDVTVVGAGFVGIACAINLHRFGFEAPCRGTRFSR